MESPSETSEERQEIEEVYCKNLHQSSIPFEIKRIETSFGDTNIIITGEKKNSPLVLIHGSNGCLTETTEIVKILTNHFQVFAIDTVAQPGLCPEMQPDRNDLSYGMWMYEILSRLYLRMVILVGISFGGFVGWKMLLHDSKHIKEAYLIGPAGIVDGNPLQASLKAFWPIQMYNWRKNPLYFRQFVEKIKNEGDEFTLELFSKVLLQFKMDYSAVPNISKTEANKIQTPLYIIACEDDVLVPGRKALARAKQIFPSLQQVKLLENSTLRYDYDSTLEITRMILKNQL
jgi:pimeloyl-ACP methyl ester carboxylesterase